MARGRGSFLVMAKRSRVHFELVSVWFMGRRGEKKREKKKKKHCESSKCFTVYSFVLK